MSHEIYGFDMAIYAFFDFLIFWHCQVIKLLLCGGEFDVLLVKHVVRNLCSSAEHDLSFSLQAQNCLPSFHMENFSIPNKTVNLSLFLNPEENRY